MLRLVFLFGFSITSSLFAASTPVTEINIDGVAVQAYFNDGDTFRVLTGHLKGKSARIKGFNALESYGPVHQWGNWRADELFDNAAAATQNARQGSWHCKLELGKDTYGRLLADCRDLAISQLQKGLAHIMFMNREDSIPELVSVQLEAIKGRVGMWQKGTVDYILTSVHSSGERELGGKLSYDRFVSTKDGISLVKTHAHSYEPCQVAHYAPAPGKTASSLVYIPFEQRYKSDHSCF